MSAVAPEPLAWSRPRPRVLPRSTRYPGPTRLTAARSGNRCPDSRLRTQTLSTAGPARSRNKHRVRHASSIWRGTEVGDPGNGSDRSRTDNQRAIFPARIDAPQINPRVCAARCPPSVNRSDTPSGNQAKSTTSRPASGVTTVVISPVLVSSIRRERVSPSSLSEMNAILCPVGDHAGSITVPQHIEVEQDRLIASVGGNLDNFPGCELCENSVPLRRPVNGWLAAATPGDWRGRRPRLARRDSQLIRTHRRVRLVTFGVRLHLPPGERQPLADQVTDQWRESLNHPAPRRAGSPRRHSALTRRRCPQQRRQLRRRREPPKDR